MQGEPLVLCLTNTVAANFTANCLLAVGARPAMVEDPDEAAELAADADAVLVNVGTVTHAQAEAMKSAIAVARRKAKPWALDPVACQFLAYRRKLVLDFLKQKPSLVRGNQDEVGFLRDLHLASLESVPVLSTGRKDFLYRGEDCLAEISGGVPMLRQVTATGCAQGALCAAFLGWGQTPEKACVCASRLMKAAGERAFARIQKPGSFQIALIDALSELAGDYHD